MFQFSGDSSLTRRCSETFARKCFSAFFHHRLQCYHNFKIFIKKNRYRRELETRVKYAGILEPVKSDY